MGRAIHRPSTTLSKIRLEPAQPDFYSFKFSRLNSKLMFEKMELEKKISLSRLNPIFFHPKIAPKLAPNTKVTVPRVASSPHNENFEFA